VSSLCLVSVGRVDEEVMSLVARRVQDVFSLAVSRGPGLPEPGHAFDVRRQQYSSVTIMRELVSRRPLETSRLLAVTEKDLFIPMLSFIYGQAQLGGHVAMVSLARLRQEFYQMPANQRLTASRAVKECFHELGHTFGLVHCLNSQCPMALSTNIVQLDQKTAEFCHACSVMLAEAIAHLGKSRDQ